MLLLGFLVQGKYFKSEGEKQILCRASPAKPKSAPKITELLLILFFNYLIKKVVIQRWRMPKPLSSVVSQKCKCGGVFFVQNHQYEKSEMEP